MASTYFELFSGAGGMSQGFHQAGYDVLGGVDYDDKAVETFDHNHDAEALCRDLTEHSPEELFAELPFDADDIDVVGGGPPCQGFSTANIDRDEDDPRNNLVFVFAEYVDYIQPDAFVMENVEGIESIDDGETVSELLSDFRESGYNVTWDVLNAADYGVPQTRKRAFFVGQKDGQPSLPTGVV